MEDVLDAVGTLRSELHIPTLSKRVARRIEQLILDGRLKPGARLVEELIARQLGISRASLREAIIGLERSGLIAREGRNARVIRRLEHSDVVELYEMWTILESEAAALACAAATRDDRDAIAQVMLATERADDKVAYHRLNLEFHRSLIAPCPNRRLVEAYDHCLKQIRWVWALAIGEAGDPAVSRREHREIADAYFARDAEATRRTIRAHLSEGAKRTISASPKLEIEQVSQGQISAA